MIPFIITMLVLLLGLYYLTIFIHLSEIYPILGDEITISLGVGLIPFYYWFKKAPVKKEPKKKMVKKTPKKTVKNPPTKKIETTKKK